MKITYDNRFHNHSINTNKEKNQGCIEEILERIESSLNSMLKKHSKVLSIRFDVRYPKGNLIKTGFMILITTSKESLIVKELKVDIEQIQSLYLYQNNITKTINISTIFFL